MASGSAADWAKRQASKRRKRSKQAKTTTGVNRNNPGTAMPQPLPESAPSEQPAEDGAEDQKSTRKMMPVNLADAEQLDATLDTAELGEIEGFGDAGVADPDLIEDGDGGTVDLGFGFDAEAATAVTTPESTSLDRNSLAGKKFGRYKVVRELARGGMGIVYQARDPKLKRDVALKVLIAGEHASEKAIQSFVREARAAGHLRHPNIVAIHDADEIDGLHYFTMDFVRGRELKDILDEGADLQDVLLWLVEICKALDYAHSNGIIHRDLKPGNIMIAEDGLPMVMDFGLARDESSNSIQSVTGQVSGTPAYMSPEQAQGKVHDIDSRTDIFAMGSILYEVVTGRRAFAGNTLVETLQAVVNDEPLNPAQLDPDIDQPLELIILHCLDKNKKNRYPSMLPLANDLTNYLLGKSISLRPPGAMAGVLSVMRSRLALIAAAAAGVLIIGLVVIIFSMGDSFMSRQRELIKIGEPESIALAVDNLANELGNRSLSAKQLEQMRQMLREQLDGPASQAALQALLRYSDEPTRDVLGINSACRQRRYGRDGHGLS